MDQLTAVIYRITCLPTSRCYVGSTQDYLVRTASHLCDLRKGRHHNSRLQRAWNKYGEANFEFEELRTVESSERYEVEQEEIDRCPKVFNTSTAGEPPSFLGGIQSPEVRDRISRNRSGIPMSEETKEKLRQQSLGVKQRPEAVEKSRRGNTGLIRNEEARENYRRSWTSQRRLEHGLKVKESNRRKKDA